MTPDEVRNRTFNRAIKLLTVKARSVAELRERLLQGKNANEAVVDTVIARLQEYGYLNDERFAFSYASLKVKQRPLGRRRLERDQGTEDGDRLVRGTPPPSHSGGRSGATAGRPPHFS